MQNEENTAIGEPLTVLQINLNTIIGRELNDGW